MYEQDYVRKGPQVENATTGLLVRYVCMNRTTIEYVRKGPQVEYVTTRILVGYACMNRTTSRGCNNRITGKVCMYVCMYEQDHW